MDKATSAAAWLAARADQVANATATSTDAAASSEGHGLNVGSNPAFKVVGVCLAVGSGLFIGSSFVIKKKGLIASTVKHGNEIGEGHGYLKSPMWWTGMIMMIVGEILNFVAYAFTVAILVTAMGSISVVVAAILSHFFLKETLTFFGWIGCILCILGSIILALNAPQEQSVRTINEFKWLFLAPGFLVWAGLCIVGSLVVVFYVAPRWGKKNMMPYISVCSLIGGISVSCTQGLGSAIITSIQGNSQIKNWFFWFLFVFVVVTLLVEINYLNKALELFNTSMVVPVYFCYFTSATMVTSFILYKGLKAPAVDLITMVLAFLVTCFGITLLQMSKVDPKALSGLDRRSTMLLQASKRGTEAEEKGDVSAMEEPGMDALRGGFGAVGSIIRARSVSRRMSMRRLSQEGFGEAQHSTDGLTHLRRYTLSDNPMPDHHPQEHIAMCPRDTGRDLSPQHTGRTSTLKFGTSDLVHQYAYTEGGAKGTGHSDAFHTMRQSSTQVPTIPYSGTSSGLSGTSSGLSLPPVHESVTSPTEEKRPFPWADPRHQSAVVSPVSPDHRHHLPERKMSFSQFFMGIAGGHNSDQEVRRGSSPRDYPRRADEGTERDERVALVAEPEEMVRSDPESDPSEGDLGSPIRGFQQAYSHSAPNLSGLPSSSSAGASASSGSNTPGLPGQGQRRPMGPRQSMSQN